MADKMTLVDVARNQNPDGTAARIAEIVQDTNPILQDMHYEEGNLDTGHQYTRHSATKKGAFVNYNEGIPNQKSDRTQHRVDCAMLKAIAEADADLVTLGAGEAHNRMVEDKGVMMGMNLEMAEKVFYGDSSTDSAQFDGLNKIVADTSARTFVDAGGTGSDNTSIYAVDWGPAKAYGVFPKGSTAGLKHTDLGRRVKDMSDGTKLPVVESLFEWKTGIAIENTNAVGRIANIDVSDLAGAGEAGYTGPNLEKLMTELDRKFRQGYEGRVYYASIDVLLALEYIAQSKANVNLTYMDFAGQKLLTFRGKPIRECDAISLAEARIV